MNGSNATTVRGNTTDRALVKCALVRVMTRPRSVLWQKAQANTGGIILQCTVTSLTFAQRDIHRTKNELVSGNQNYELQMKGALVPQARSHTTKA